MFEKSDNRTQRQVGRETDRKKVRQADRLTDRQRNRQTERQTECLVDGNLALRSIGTQPFHDRCSPKLEQSADEDFVLLI